jgi:hypothetical protein
LIQATHHYNFTQNQNRYGETAKKILEELGAWLMAAVFIFLVFSLVTFILDNVYKGDCQREFYHVIIDSHLLDNTFKSDTV